MKEQEPTDDSDSDEPPLLVDQSQSSSDTEESSESSDNEYEAKDMDEEFAKAINNAPAPEEAPSQKPVDQPTPTPSCAKKSPPPPVSSLNQPALPESPNKGNTRRWRYEWERDPSYNLVEYQPPRLTRKTPMQRRWRHQKH